MRLSVADVFAQLKLDGLATDAADAPARAALETELRDHLPWYVRAAVGFGAWLATAFFLGFLVLFLLWGVFLIVVCATFHFCL